MNLLIIGDVHGCFHTFSELLTHWRPATEYLIQVSQQESYEMTRRAAREEGIFVGVSSGASLAAIAKKLVDMPQNARVLTFCYDTGERYLSVDGLFV